MLIDYWIDWIFFKYKKAFPIFAYLKMNKLMEFSTKLLCKWYCQYYYLTNDICFSGCRNWGTNACDIFYNCGLFWLLLPNQPHVSCSSNELRRRSGKCWCGKILFYVKSHNIYENVSKSWKFKWKQKHFSWKKKEW